MTNEEIFQKAIEKAEAQGFDFSKWKDNHFGVHHNWREDEVRFAQYFSQDALLFSHDFAKAFFGEHCVGENGQIHKPYDLNCSPEWVVQIQNLALSEDRLAYIAKFLDQ